MALHVDITVRKKFVLCYKFVQRDYEVFARFSEINQSTQILTSHLVYETLGPIYEQKSKSPTSCGKVRQTPLFFSQCIANLRSLVDIQGGNIQIDGQEVKYSRFFN